LFSITVIIKAHTNEVVNVFLSKKYPMPLGMGTAMRLRSRGAPGPTSPFICFFSVNF
jgi:hypothetical protein